MAAREGIIYYLRISSKNDFLSLKPGAQLQLALIRHPANHMPRRHQPGINWARLELICSASPAAPAGVKLRRPETGDRVVAREDHHGDARAFEAGGHPRLPPGRSRFRGLCLQAASRWLSGMWLIANW